MNEQGADEPRQQMSEEEMRARLAEELKKVKVRDVLLQSVVSLINLGGQRLGISPETSDVRDLAQARLAIEAVRVLVPLLEEDSPGELGPVRDALAQLQVAYAREAASEEGGQEPGEQAAGQQAQEAGSSADAGRSARDSGLWVPPGSKT